LAGFLAFGRALRTAPLVLIAAFDFGLAFDFDFAFAFDFHVTALRRW